jgi:hypothetical protein
VANDHLQKLREAIVGILDAHAALVAIIGRANNFVVAWDNLGDTDKATLSAGMLAYFVLPGARLAADKNAELWTIQFAAVAAEESTTNEIIFALIGDSNTTGALTGAAFQAHGLDAAIDDWTRRPMPPDPDEELARADIDITFRCYF